MMQIRSLLNDKLALIVGLIILSTVFYLVGISIERSAEAHEAPHQESRTETESHDEANERAEAHESETETQHEETSRETFLGVNLEAPEIVAGIVLGWIALTIILLVFKQRALPLIILAGAVATIFDLIEVVAQINRSSMSVAFLAMLVAITHALMIVLAFRQLTMQARGNQAAIQ